MRFLALKTQADKWIADYIIKKVQDNIVNSDKPFVLGLPTGGTPMQVYKHLIAAYERKEVSFKDVVTFNMDEYIGLPPEHPQSYRYFMQENFFKHVDIPEENIHIPNGMAKNLALEAQEYEEKIQSFGGIDLFFGGVGSDGHIAFNEPGSSLGSRTRDKMLTLQTLQDNARFFDNDISKVPVSAMTVGIQTIMSAKEVIILAKGANKALAVHHAIEGSINHIWSISAFQMHPAFIMVADKDASLELKYKTLQYFAQIEGAENPELCEELICYPHKRNAC